MKTSTVLRVDIYSVFYIVMHTVHLSRIAIVLGFLIVWISDPSRPKP